MKINLHDRVGTFAENKDTAKHLRVTSIVPALKRGDEEVILDFAGVSGTTQSFVHALIADAIRDPSLDALDHLVFEHCNEVVQAVIEIVVSYSQEEWGDADELDG